jgi:pimeloyl-ACP methyl ester carboxylesterase
MGVESIQPYEEVGVTTSIAEWALDERVRVAGGDVATGVFGGGPPVVLVHGTPAAGHLWRGVVGPLAQHHAVYVYDMPGFGSSQPAPGTRPTIAQQARTLIELVAHWGLEAPALVGHDIGGGVIARAHLLERLPASHLAFLDGAVIGPWNTPFTEHQKRHVDAWRSMPNDVFDEIVSTRLRTAVHGAMTDAVLDAYHAPWAGSDGQRRWIDQVDAVDHVDTLAAA